MHYPLCSSLHHNKQNCLSFRQHVLQGIADEMKGKVSVVKIDTDKYPNIASRYGIKVRDLPPAH